MAEEIRLAGGQDHQFEQVTPRLPGRQVPVEGVSHDSPGVGPLGVSDEQESFARLELVQQGQDQFRIRLHKLLRTAQDLGFQLPLHVRLVQSPFDLPVQVGVTDRTRQQPSVEAVHQLGVHGRLGQREQRVQKHEAAVRQLDLRPAVHFALGVERHRPGSVAGAGDVAEPVGLDQVAQFRVDQEAADDLFRVEPHVADRPAETRQLVPERQKRPLLPCLDLVVHQGVIHVVSHGPDAAQVQRAVAVNPPFRRGHGGDVFRGGHHGFPGRQVGGAVGARRGHLVRVAAIGRITWSAVSSRRRRRGRNEAPAAGRSSACAASAPPRG